MYRIGLVIYDNVEELDFVGPYEVLSYANKIKEHSVKVCLVAEREQVVRCSNGLRVLTNYSFGNCPHFDVLVVPGGRGRQKEMHNPNLLDFVRTKMREVQYMASVCTGAFILAQAGVLKGKNVTTHYMAKEELARDASVTLTDGRVVADGKIITAGGVSAGIDLGLYLLQVLFDSEMAREVAKRIEYQSPVL